MLLAIGTIVLALGVVAAAWGRAIDAEVRGRVISARPAVRRVV